MTRRSERSRVTPPSSQLLMLVLLGAMLATHGGAFASVASAQESTSDPALRAAYFSALREEATARLQAARVDIEQQQQVYGTPQTPNSDPAFHDLITADFRMLRMAVSQSKSWLDQAQLHGYLAHQSHAIQQTLNFFLFTDGGRAEWQSFRFDVESRLVALLSRVSTVAIIDHGRQLVASVNDDDTVHWKTFEGECAVTHHCIDVEHDIRYVLDSDIDAPHVRNSRLAQLSAHIEDEYVTMGALASEHGWNFPILLTPVSWNQTLADVLRDPALTEQTFVDVYRRALNEASNRVRDELARFAAMKVDSLAELSSYDELREAVLGRFGMKYAQVAHDVAQEKTWEQHFDDIRAHLWTAVLIGSGIALVGALASPFLAGAGVLGAVVAALTGATAANTLAIAGTALLVVDAAVEYGRYQRSLRAASLGMWSPVLSTSRVADEHLGAFRELLVWTAADAMLPYSFVMLRMLRAPAKRQLVGQLYGHLRRAVQTKQASLRNAASTSLLPLVRRIASTSPKRLVSIGLQSTIVAASSGALASAYPMAVSNTSASPSWTSDARLARESVFDRATALKAGFAGAVTPGAIASLIDVARAEPDHVINGFYVVDAHGKLFLISESAATSVAEYWGFDAHTVDWAAVLARGGETAMRVRAHGRLSLQLRDNRLVLVHASDIGLVARAAALPTAAQDEGYRNALLLGLPDSIDVDIADESVGAVIDALSLR
jgi:hypothetical protein